MNNVSFRGLYVLTGKPENARTDFGDTIQDMSNWKMKSFLN